MSKLQVTVSFQYEPNPACYPANTSLELMAKLDKLNLQGDTESLLEILADTSYVCDVSVVSEEAG